MKWASNIVFIVFIIISLIIIFPLLLLKNQQGQPPSIFGYKIMNVLSGSMEPLLEPGDIIFVKEIDINQVKVNDVVTYQKGQQTFVTHRVVDIFENRDDVSFQTKGDANNVSDQDLVTPNQIVGTLKMHIPNVGSIANVIKSTGGLSLIIGITFIIFLFRRIRVVFTQQV
ncbi:signal peptidase I [Bacillus timonensis]|nr:signal peptidase I [Bacillus timonensis]